MPRSMTVSAFVALCALGMAQNQPTAPSLPRMRADLEYLCSEKLQGRASLSPGADLAASYIAAEFKKAGLAPLVPHGDFLQKFALIAPSSPSSLPPQGTLATVRERTRIEFLPGKDYRTTYLKELKISAPVAFAGYGIVA